jgi:hypothetical protein
MVTDAQIASGQLAFNKIARGQKVSRHGIGIGIGRNSCSRNPIPKKTANSIGGGAITPGVSELEPGAAGAVIYDKNLP